MNEPFVKVITQTMGVLSAGTDRDLNIGVVINSDTGPVEITKVNNQNEFIDLYLSNNQLLPSDDVTVKHAYKLLRYTPLYITRASDNSVLCGLTSNGSLIYTNKNYKPFKTSTQFSIEPNTVTFNNIFIVVSIDGKNMLVYEGTEGELPTTVSNISTDTLFVAGTYGGAFDLENTSSGTSRVWSRTASDGKVYKIDYQTDKWVLYELGSDIILSQKSGDASSEPWYGTWSNSYQVSNAVVFINNVTTGYKNFFTAVNTQSNSSNKNISNILGCTVSETGNTVNVKFERQLSIIESNTNDFTSTYVSAATASIDFNNSNTDINSSMYVGINGNSYYYVGRYNNPNNYPGNPVAITPFKGTLTSYNQTINSGLYFTYIVDSIMNDLSNPPLEDRTTYNTTCSSISSCTFFGSYYEDAGDASGNDPISYVSADHKLVCSNNSIINDIGIVLGFTGQTKSIVVYTSGTDVSDYTGANYILVEATGVHTAGLLLARISEILTGSNYPSVSGDYANLASFVRTISAVTEYNVTFTRATANIIYQTSDLTFEKSSSLSDAVLPRPTYNDSTTYTKYAFPSNDQIIADTIYNNITIILKLNDLYDAASNKYLFYVGNNTVPTETGDIVVQLSTEGLTFTQLKSKLYTAINNIFDSVRLDNGFSIFDLESTYSYEISCNKADILNFGISTKNYETQLDGSRIGVVSKFTNRNKICNFSIKSTNDPEIFEITLIHNVNNNRNDTGSKTYEFSMNPDKQSSSGVNIYYTYINDLNKYFDIIELNSEKSLPSDFMSRLFGNEAPLADPESDDYILAAHRFTVPNGVYYSFLFDCGYVDAAYASALCSYGQQIYAEAVISPEDTDDPDQIVRYRNAVSAGTGQVAWEGAMDAPWLSDNTVSDFYMSTSPGAEYIISVLNNANSAKEFAPVYGKTNGTMSLQPKYTFTKDEREMMLDNQVNTIVWNPARNAAIKNLDLTLLKDSTYLSTRNNVRMVNAAAHICDEVMQNYHGWFSRVATWNNVTATLETELNARLMTSQQYGPARIRVICNETNNPVEVQEKNQLIVDVAFQFYNEIRWIYVYQKIYNLSENLDNLQ